MTTESDRSAAEEAIVAYAWALDSKDWPALRALLSDGEAADELLHILPTITGELPPSSSGTRNG